MSKINLAFLWHHHQPVYREGPNSSHNYAMPWVRLHATKDYYDMAAILDGFPKIKMNFNIVPSLLVQLDEYAKGLAVDKELELTLKPANELTAEDKIYILQNFFMSNWNTMVNPNKRYRELLQKRGTHTFYNGSKRILNYFTENDFRDLQVWFNLSWFDPYWRKTNDFVKNMFQKGTNFTEEDKHMLVALQREICGKIPFKYRELQDKGQIEVSVSPFFHPILPLVYNTEIAKIAMPKVTLPEKFSQPEDAREQIIRAVDYYEKVFGKKPNGMWPSEGSVSEQIIGLLADSGIKWIATDEEILFNTIKIIREKTAGQIPHEILYQPYTVTKDNKSLNIIFRDRYLSDAIGFKYYNWHSRDAVGNFIKYISDTYEKSSKENNFLISVILDGENCWEAYPEDGWVFLTELYQRLSDDKNIQTVTISEFLDKNPPKVTLKKLWPGSWINANFGIWIGHSEDNTAWRLLSETRKFLVEYLQKNPAEVTDSIKQSCWEQIYTAEGSDWNWWYGNEHSSGLDDIFDNLFRKHLISVYELLNEPVPDELHIAIKKPFVKQPTIEPIDFIHPVIDGKITSYFEWLSAGSYESGHRGGSMHQVDSVISQFYYGFDLQNLYFRLDVHEIETALENIGFSISFLKPENKQIIISFDKNNTLQEFYLKEEKQNGEIIKTKLESMSVNRIIELSIQFSALGININDGIEFIITANKLFKENDKVTSSEIERLPYQDTVKFVRPGEDFADRDWSAL